MVWQKSQLGRPDEKKEELRQVHSFGLPLFINPARPVPQHMPNGNPRYFALDATGLTFLVEQLVHDAIAESGWTPGARRHIKSRRAEAAAKACFPPLIGQLPVGVTTESPHCCGWPPRV